MTRLARLLPLLTATAWLITVLLPILDSGDDRGPRIVVTSLGGDRLDLADVELPFVLAWLGVVGCAVTVWLLRSLRWWSIAAVFVALLLGAFLISMIIDPPSAVWDGVDAQGRPAGGLTVGEPAAGTVLWAVGIAALAAAGVCGFIGASRSPTVRLQPTV